MYQPLFQQPVLNIVQATPELTWFEFVLNPDLLKQHVRYIAVV